MPENDEHSDEIQAHVFAGPSWDEDEESRDADEEQVVDEADDVEAHASGGFNSPE